MKSFYKYLTRTPFNSLFDIWEEYPEAELVPIKARADVFYQMSMDIEEEPISFIYHLN